MSSKGQEASTLNSTKQLLDELDALMEKMLALPVSNVEESASRPEEAERLARVSATLTVLETGLQREGASALSRDQGSPRGSGSESPRVDEAATMGPPHVEFMSESMGRSHQEEALASPARSPGWGAAEEAEIPAGAIPLSLLQVEAPEVTVLPPRPRPWLNLLIVPLLVINVAFDVCTFFLGPLGRWLRTGQGRSFLAFAGIVLIVLAVGWLVRDWMSWTQ